ncbi:MAG TPA: hypothetical protein VGG22_03405 [Candidatus Baltobacteraceae bacterium]
MSEVKITPAPSDDEAAAIMIALHDEEDPPTPAVQSRWIMSGRQYDEDYEAPSR